jgi:MFS family permease
METQDQLQEPTVWQERPLLGDRRFATLWLVQGLAQTAHYALLFTLLVVVLDLTSSSTHMGLLVLSFILPSILVGMAIGVLLDRWRRVPVMVVTNVLRALACILYLFFHQEVLAVYAVSLGFASAGLFFNPAVVALIPALVPRQRLVNANSLYNFTMTGSQLLGLVFLAPAILKGFGEEVMFVTAAVIFILSAALSASLRGIDEGASGLSEKLPFAAIPRQFRESWRALRGDVASFLAMGQLITASTLVLLFAILVPRYMQDVLHIAPNNAAFVFAPTGVGALVGLRFLSWATRRMGKNRVVMVGLMGVALCLVALALVKPLAEVLKHTPLDPGERLAGLSLLQAMTMIFAGPMGFAYAFLNAPAQTVLHERAPAGMRGRIFTTQVVSANFLSLLPLLFIGGLIDLLDGLANLPGVTIVLLLVALVLGGLAMGSSRVGGVVEREEALAAASQLERDASTPGQLVRKRGDA